MSEELCATDGCGKPAVGRYEAGGVGSAHCQSCLNAIAGTKYGIDYEQEYHEERKARYAAQSELVASQSRLSEAVKVLEPFAHLGDVILSEAPPNASHAQLFTDSEGGVHTVSLEQFRADRQFLATLGEEK